MAIWLALLALAAVVVSVVLYQRRVRSADPSPRRGAGRLAQRVEQATAEQAAARDTYVDEQAAIWASGQAAGSGRPVLFEEDLGRPDPRSPEAYDVSDLYASLEESEASVEDAVEDLADADFAWDGVDELGEGAADRAFAADLDDVDDDPEFDRFAPRRSATEVGGGATETDEFVSELLGTGDVHAGAGGLESTEGANEPLERRTPKATADAYKQPLRLARTQQRPAGTSRRSPEQMRSMLLNYRGGMKKGREQPRDESGGDEG